MLKTLCSIAFALVMATGLLGNAAFANEHDHAKAPCAHCVATHDTCCKAPDGHIMAHEDCDHCKVNHCCAK